jgi:hypothetical protein
MPSLPRRVTHPHSTATLQIPGGKGKGALIKDKPGGSYVIAVFPQYRLRGAPGTDQGWREFSVTLAYENTDYVLPGGQKIVCSWGQTPLLETADISATLFVPYNAMSTNIADGQYDIRYLVTLQQNQKVLQRSTVISNDYYLEVRNGSGNRPPRFYDVVLPAPPAPR